MEDADICDFATAIVEFEGGPMDAGWGSRWKTLVVAIVVAIIRYLVVRGLVSSWLVSPGQGSQPPKCRS